MTSKHLKQIVTISAALRDDFLDRFPHLSQHILVAHDGADPDLAESHRTPVFPPSPGRLLVGYSGHLYRGKGIELIAELAIRCPWADFLVIGGTNDAVDYWRQHLADHTNIRFCGQVPHTSVPDHLAGCQVVLAPYGGRVLISDGKTDVSRWMSPLKIFEYMSLGKAILCTDLPVLREILVDGQNALLCPPDDPGIWASTLQRLATNPGMRQTLGATARADFEARYTWHKRAQSILANARF